MEATCVFVEPQGVLRHALDVGVTRNMSLASVPWQGWNKNFVELS